MTRAIHDTTAAIAVGQDFIDENFFPSPTQKNNYEKGNTVYEAFADVHSKAVLACINATMVIFEEDNPNFNETKFINSIIHPTEGTQHDK